MEQLPLIPSLALAFTVLSSAVGLGWYVAKQFAEQRQYMHDNLAAKKSVEELKAVVEKIKDQHEELKDRVLVLELKPGRAGGRTVPPVVAVS